MRSQAITWNAVSNCSQGTASQFGYAFAAADSLYAPGTPYSHKTIIVYQHKSTTRFIH